MALFVLLGFLQQKPISKRRVSARPPDRPVVHFGIFRQQY